MLTWLWTTNTPINQIFFLEKILLWKHQMSVTLLRESLHFELDLSISFFPNEILTFGHFLDVIGNSLIWNLILNFRKLTTQYTYSKHLWTIYVTKCLGFKMKISKIVHCGPSIKSQSHFGFRLSTFVTNSDFCQELDIRSSVWKLKITTKGIIVAKKTNC